MTKPGNFKEDTSSEKKEETPRRRVSWLDRQDETAGEGDQDLRSG